MIIKLYQQFKIALDVLLLNINLLIIFIYLGMYPLSTSDLTVTSWVLFNSPEIEYALICHEIQSKEKQG